MTQIEQSAARQRIDRIKAAVDAVREEVGAADWMALGYESWEAMCEAEFGFVLDLGDVGRGNER